jgi:hypothetical protein
MIRLVILKGFVKTWKTAIAISDKLSPTTWTVFLLASILLTVASAYQLGALINPSAPPVAHHNVRPDTPPSTAHVQGGLPAREYGGNCVFYAWASNGTTATAKGYDIPFGHVSQVPHISSITGISPTATGQAFTLSVSGSNFYPHFFCTVTSSAAQYSLRVFNPNGPSEPPLTISDGTAPGPSRDFAYWLFILNLVSTAFSTIISALVSVSLAIINWITIYRARSDYILKRGEFAVKILELCQRSRQNEHELTLKTREMDLKKRDMDIKEAEFRLKEIEFQLRLKQVELEMIKTQLEIDAAKPGPRIVTER